MKTWLVNDGEKVHCIQADKIEFTCSKAGNMSLDFISANNDIVAMFAKWEWCKETPLAVLSQEDMKNAAVDLRSWFAREKKERTRDRRPPIEPGKETDHAVARAIGWFMMYPASHRPHWYSLAGNVADKSCGVVPFKPSTDIHFANIAISEHIGMEIYCEASIKPIDICRYILTHTRPEKIRGAEAHKVPKVVPVEDAYEVVDAMTGVEELIYGVPPIKSESIREKE